MSMLNVDLKDKAHIYQLVAGLTAVTLISLGCLAVMTPFFPAILLATILTLSAWPAFMWLNTKLKRRTALSAFLMTLALALSFIMPLLIIGTSVTENFTNVYSIIQDFLKGDLQQIAFMIEKIPYVGESLAQGWTSLTADRQKLIAISHEYAGSMTDIMIKIGGTIGRGLLDVTLGVLISYFFFRHGTRAAVRISNLINTFGGARGQQLLEVTKNTLIGVVYGILGTALVQGALASFGFWVAKVPGASFLGLMTFFLSFLPFGPPLIWVPVTLWLYGEGHAYMSFFMLIWGLFVISATDNVLRPYFISLGSSLPFLLVLMGVVGGLVSFGFIGMFIGPTLLSLAYALIIEWSRSHPPSGDDDAANKEA